jgi:hypothetical protein
VLAHGRCDVEARKVKLPAPVVALWVVSACALVGVSLLFAWPDGAERRGGHSSRTELEIVFWPQGKAQGAPRRFRLACAPERAGDHPRLDEACVRAAQLDLSLFAPAADEACTLLYGGPHEAHVSGVLRGRAIDLWLSRSDGCEIARWDALVPILPPFR